MFWKNTFFINLSNIHMMGTYYMLRNLEINTKTEYLSLRKLQSNNNSVPAFVQLSLDVWYTYNLLIIFISLKRLYKDKNKSKTVKLSNSDSRFTGSCKFVEVKLWLERTPDFNLLLKMIVVWCLFLKLRKTLTPIRWSAVAGHFGVLAEDEW